MALTDLAIRSVKPKDRPYKLGDALGLFFLVQPSGGKLWRLKYRLEGKERKLAISSYPALSLGEARKRRDEARELMAAGKDPSREKRRDKVRARAAAANSFATLVAEYCAKRMRDGVGGWAPATAKRSEYLLGQLTRPLGNNAGNGHRARGRTGGDSEDRNRGQLGECSAHVTARECRFPLCGRNSTPSLRSDARSQGGALGTESYALWRDHGCQPCRRSASCHWGL